MRRTTSTTNRIASSDPPAADAPTVFHIFEDDISRSPVGAPRFDSPSDILSISRGVPNSDAVGEELGTKLEASRGADNGFELGLSLSMEKDVKLGE